MKKIISMAIAIIALISLNNCGSSNTDNPNTYTKSIKLTEDKNTSLTIDGKDGDKLMLYIPPLPFGKKVQDVTFTLKYINKLPLIEIDKDIEFIMPIKLKFTSNNINDNNISLVYYALDKDYYITSVVKDHTIEANLFHFSSYGFDSIPEVSDKLHEDINSRLHTLDENSANKRYSELDYDQINDLNVKIKAYQDNLEFDDMIASYANSIASAAHNTISYYKNTELTYFSKQCPTNELLKALNELTQIKVIADELLKYNAVKNNDLAYNILRDISLSEATDMANLILTKSKEMWDKIAIPKCDDKSKLWDYIKCTNKYISDLEMSMIYSDDLGTDGIDLSEKTKQELDDAIASDAMEALNSKDCTCMIVYLDTLNTYFANTQKDLIELLTDETNKCEGRCPLLWDISVTYNNIYDGSPDITWSGHAEFKNVYIEQKDDAWVALPPKERNACQSYHENYKSGELPTASLVTGDLEDGYTMTDYLYVRTNDDGTPYIQLVDFNINKDIYNKLNDFSTFTVSGEGKGTTTYEFIPQVPGYKYP